MNQECKEQRRYLKLISVCLVILSSIAVVFFLARLQAVFVPLIVAVLIYFMLIPLVNFLSDQRFVSHILSVGLTSLLGLGLLQFGVFMLFYATEKVATSLDTYRRKVSELLSSDSFPEYINIENMEQLDLSQFVDYLRAFSSGAMGVAGSFVMINIFLFFFLNTRTDPAKLGSLVGRIKKQISRYIWIKIIISTVTGALVYAFFSLLGVDLAFTYGLIVFLLNFIPNVGAIIATLVPLPIIYLQFGLSPEFLLGLFVPGFLQLSIGNIIEPKLMGNRLGLHPIVILFFLIFWGTVWGPIGMFLAIPITAAIKIISSEIEGLYFLDAVLQGDLKRAKSLLEA